MKIPRRPGKSLSYYAALSWIIPGIIAILTCIFVFIASTTVEYRSEVRRIESELQEKSNTVARRLSAELLIGQRGAVQSVSELLKKEFSLISIEITSKAPCSEELCLTREGKTIVAARRLPIIDEPYYVQITSNAPTFLEVLNLRTLIWISLPIALMLGLGLAFQRIILRRYFIKPIQALVETSTGTGEACDYWPEEIRDISDQLSKSFELREGEVLSQIARGVIHDLRTLIHTPLAASELVAEQLTNTEERTAQLEHLQKVAEQQLPKMKQIIDNTLDGNREITVKKELRSIADTIDGAKKTLESIAIQSKTTIEIQSSEDSFILAHDKSQLERALTNLIKNGIEACYESDQKSSRLVRVSVHGSDSEVTIDIEDSGPGLRITGDNVFRPLKSTKAHGSGLGLSISKKIIQAHGGALVPGKSKDFGGAKFSVVLPAGGAR